MELKKISGKTLGEARANARKTYGDRYVIVEAGNSTPTSSAYITIALEPETAKREETRLPSSENADSEKPKNLKADTREDRNAENSANRGRERVAESSEKPAGMIAPLLKQIDRLIESGTETISSLKKISTPEAVKESGSTPESKNGSSQFPGVTYIKSGTDSSMQHRTLDGRAHHTVPDRTDSSMQHRTQAPQKPASHAATGYGRNSAVGNSGKVKQAPTARQEEAQTERAAPKPATAWKTSVLPLKEGSDNRNKVPSEEKADFRQYFRKKPSGSGRQETDEPQLKKLKHRIETLERMVGSFTDNHSPWSGDPLYRFLRAQKFQPDFLMEWMGGRPAEPEGKERDSETDPAAGTDLLHQQIRARAESYFETADPLSRSNKHLFTSFPGVNVTRLISALANTCKQNEQEFRVGIIFSDSFENDELSFQLMDAFKAINTECRDIVTHRDWQNLSATTDPDTLLFLVTHPMPYNRGEVESAWSHFNRVLGEYHTVKHHFIAHSLHNPSEIIQMLPESHPFSPDYVDLINLEMSRASYGRLTEYREKAGLEFGFFHRDNHSWTDPFGTIEKNLASLVFRDFQHSVDHEKTEDSLFLHV